MPYDIVLLSPQYRAEFSVVWIAGTRGIKYVSKKDILSADIEKLCNDIMTKLITPMQKPQAQLSLSLSAKLVNGTIKVFHQKALVLQKSLNDYLPYVYNPCKPVPVDKRRNKRKPGLSYEVKRPIQKADDVWDLPELQLTDRDVEKALQDAPSVAIDSITLREEIPRTTMPFEEEGGFGDQELAVELRSHTTEVNWAELESRKEILDAIEITSLQEISEMEPVEDTVSKRPQTPKKYKLPSTIEEPIRKPPGAPKKHKAPADTEKELCIVPEEEAQKKSVKRRKVIVTRRRLYVKRRKVFVKARLRPRWKLMRCADLQDEDEFYSDCGLTIDVNIFRNINEEWVDMMPNTPVDEARAEELWRSQPSCSGSSLLRTSRDTPAAIDDENDAAGDAIKQTSKPTIEPILRLERIRTPKSEIPQIPVSHSTAMDLKGRYVAALERITEEISNIEISLQEAILHQEKEIPPQKEDLPVSSPTNKRLQDIVRIVKDWNFAAGDLTVEDVCIKPLNRLNVAITFNDLLYLHKMQYIILLKKQNSLAVKKIVKGPKLLAKEDI